MFEIPARLVGESNQREHWAARARRAKTHRECGYMYARANRVSVALVPCIVRITRIAPRKLDDDNLQGSAKAVRDGLADALGVKDNDPRVTWLPVEQERGKANQYKVRVQIERREG